MLNNLAFQIKLSRIKKLEKRCWSQSQNERSAGSVPALLPWPCGRGHPLKFELPTSWVCAELKGEKIHVRTCRKIFIVLPSTQDDAQGPRHDLTTPESTPPGPSSRHRALRHTGLQGSEADEASLCAFRESSDCEAIGHASSLNIHSTTTCVPRLDPGLVVPRAMCWEPKGCAARGWDSRSCPNFFTSSPRALCADGRRVRTSKAWPTHSLPRPARRCPDQPSSCLPIKGNSKF